MYIIIEIQTGDFFKKQALTSDDYSDCILGIIDIISISDRKNPEFYNPETAEWNDVEELKNQH
jgi:hypothetical protein